MRIERKTERKEKDEWWNWKKEEKEGEIENKRIENECHKKEI